MILWVVMILFVTSVVLSILADRNCWEKDDLCFTVACVLGGILILMGTVVGTVNVQKDAKVAQYTSRYEDLTMAIDCGMFDKASDNGEARYKLYSDVRAWNESLAYNQAAYHNVWTYVFLPDIYDQFEFIEVKAIGEGL